MNYELFSEKKTYGVLTDRSDGPRLASDQHDTISESAEDLSLTLEKSRIDAAGDETDLPIRTIHEKADMAVLLSSHPGKS